MTSYTSFNQPPPSLGNQYVDDVALRSLLRRILPAEVRESIESELHEMGELAGGELYELSLRDRLNEPTLTQWSPWGERIDKIELTAVWKRAEELAATRGLVATAYDSPHGALARIHQFALVFLFGPSTDTYSCPLAMTDGAARCLLSSGEQELVDRAVPRLTSRDPEKFWTSGQWMTESRGGSDVSQTETTARLGADGKWSLWGRKWFTSAATSQIALTLARPEGNPAGSRGLAMFYVETFDETAQRPGIRVNRLKDKLGTRKLPTAELSLEGAPAQLVGATSRGVRQITPMLNITRTWNGVIAAATLRRGVALATNYAQKRHAFGHRLADKPLHSDTLAGMHAEAEGAMHFAFRIATLLGRAEHGDDEAALRLRVLTPIMKLTTGRQAVNGSSEALEAFGGAGYIEDTGLPSLLRDAQVLSIWEGTTNVLALDMLRALSQQEAWGAVEREIEELLATPSDESLKEAAEQVLSATSTVRAWIQETALEKPEQLEADARRAALTLGRSLELAAMIGHAQWALDTESDPRPAAVARRFLGHGIKQTQSLPVSDAKHILGH